MRITKNLRSSSLGAFGEIQEEESYRFYGELVNHPKYGVQLKVDSYQQEQPTSEQGLINYLSGEKFPGIGKKTAEKIVGLLGDQSIDRMLEDPVLLEQIPGLNESKRKMILDTVRLNHGMDQVIVGLAAMDLVVSFLLPFTKHTKMKH